MDIFWLLFCFGALFTEVEAESTVEGVFDFFF